MISSPGTWVHNVTASVLILTMTGSPFMVGLVNFATFIPTLILGPLAGALGDRFNRRLVVGICLSVASLLAATLTVLTAAGWIAPWSLVTMCLLIGAMTALCQPSQVAILPALVRRDEISRATALNVMQFQFGQIAGPALATLVLLVANPAWAFGINAVSFLGPVAAMALIRPAAPTDGNRTGAGNGRFSEGLRLVWRSATLPAVLGSVILVNASTEALRTLAPTIAHNLGDATLAGLIILGSSSGAVLGLVLFGRFEARLSPSVLLALGFGLQAVGGVSLVLAPNLWLTVLAAVPIGLGFSFSVPLLSAFLQRSTPDAMRSRIMSTYTMAHLGFRPVFALVAGGLASVVGAPLVAVCFAVLAAVSAGLARRNRIAEAPA
jgi:MFS family permease